MMLAFINWLLMQELRKLMKRFEQFIKYAIVGASGTAIDVGLLYVLVEFAGFNVYVATVVAFLVALTNNFIFNHLWTFKSRSKNYRKLYTKFFLVSLAGLLLTVAFMYLFVDIFDIYYPVAKLMTSAVVLVWNFLANKFWTFRLRPKDLQIPVQFPYELSIVVPAYNEENRIKTTLLSIKDFLEKQEISAEVLVVNDGSTDATTTVVKDLQRRMPELVLINRRTNQGKGAAVRKGVLQSKGSLILFTDADNSTPIEEFLKLRDYLTENEAQVAIGSRYLHDSEVKVKQPLYRIWISRCANLLIRLFLVDDIKDTQCGFKLFKHEAAKEIFHFQKISRFAFDMEAMVVANNLGYKVVEVPVSWFNSLESRVRPIKDSLRTLRDLVYIKLNLWSGRYSSD